MRPILGIALCGLSILWSSPGLAAGPEASDAPVAEARQALLDAINSFRQDAGAPPLALDGALSQAAAEHAGEVAHRGSLDLPAGASDRMQERLSAAGYTASRWTESLAATSRPLDVWIDDWPDQQPADFARAMDPGLKNLGVGVAKMGELELFVLLFAAPTVGETAAPLTVQVADLAALRREMLTKLNRLRRDKGLKSRLSAATFLDRAAQRHADDLLARGYFDHASPEGRTVRQRVEREGYSFLTVGENLAEGQTTIDQLLAHWYDSPPHRAVLLAPEMEEIGLGMARGQDSHGRTRIVWVLVAAAPRG